MPPVDATNASKIAAKPPVATAIVRTIPAHLWESIASFYVGFGLVELICLAGGLKQDPVPMKDIVLMLLAGGSTMGLARGVMRKVIWPKNADSDEIDNSKLRIITKASFNCLVIIASIPVGRLILTQKIPVETLFLVGYQFLGMWLYLLLLKGPLKKLSKEVQKCLNPPMERPMPSLGQPIDVEAQNPLAEQLLIGSLNLPKTRTPC